MFKNKIKLNKIGSAYLTGDGLHDGVKAALRRVEVTRDVGLQHLRLEHPVIQVTHLNPLRTRVAKG